MIVLCALGFILQMVLVVVFIFGLGLFLLGLLPDADDLLATGCVLLLIVVVLLGIGIIFWSFGVTC